MTITATGTVSFSDLRTEFVGGNSAISLGDLYRGGTNIKKKAGDNTAVNDAASVPTSGVIDVQDFHGSGKGFTKTYSTAATDQNASSIFGDDYDLDYPKNIVINAGVELGATSTSEEALEIPAGGAGTITITNNGTLSGYGGAAGAAGGDAFEAASTCTLINTGTLRSGGGGGGAGGAGGSGSFTTVSYTFTNFHTFMDINTSFGWCRPLVSQLYRGNVGNTTTPGTVCNNGYGYYVGNYVTANKYTIGTASTTNTTGGSGGAGGVGAGYGVSAGSGSAGGSGGTNAGNGGTGGSGGAFGAAGSTGSTGNNGNTSNGSAGSAGGAAGAYLRGSSNVTFTNNGTVAGNNVS